MQQEFIKKPVLSTVLSLGIVILGLVGLVTLPVEKYPDIASTMIKVSTSFPGANADVVLNSVIAPLEEQINGVEQMKYITSSARNDGSGEINVYFNLGVDPDMACVNVQNRVAAATSKLPSEVVSMGITTTKVQNGTLLFIALNSSNQLHDETFLQNYARINVVPVLQRINGVGEVMVYGARDYSMRVWLNPDKMAAYKLSPAEVMAAIAEQSKEVGPGRLGSNSAQSFEYSIKYKGRLNRPEEFEKIVLRAKDGGDVLYLRDVANIEFGAFSYTTGSSANGNPSCVMALKQTKGSNSMEIIDDAKEVLDEISASLPQGAEFSIAQDASEFIDASIDSVVETLRDAFILVFLVVLIFLQSVRSTIIPIISAGVAIVGTFFFLSMMGYSINLLTLFALVLSIGVVVDDAIVVVEAIHERLDRGERDMLKIAIDSMREITPALISVSMVFMAFFLPVTMMGGPTGVFYRQFAVTMSIAVAISAVNALTLSPALCAILIKPHVEGEGDGRKSLPQRFYDWFNVKFANFTKGYMKFLQIFMDRKWLTVCVMAVISAITAFLMLTTPSGFIPSEDQGSMFYDVTLPVGASLERTTKAMNQIDSIVAEMPIVEQRLDVKGVSILSGAYGGSYGLGVLKVKHWSEREGVNIKEVYGDFMQRMQSIKDAKVTALLPPAVDGYGTSDGVELQLLDKVGVPATELEAVLGDYLRRLNGRQEIAYAVSSFSAKFPQYEMTVDVDKCKLMGISLDQVFQAMQVYVGGSVAGSFSRFSKYYRVMLQTDPTAREVVEDLKSIYVKNSKGEMLPLSSVVEFNRVFGSELLKRFNLFNSATINLGVAEGYSSGDVIEAINEEAAQLPNGYGTAYSGATLDQIASGSQFIYIFMLCVVIVYLILCGLYNSYIIPLSVMFTLIVGMFGVFAAINIVGIENNIYVQVAMIMMNGLIAKNAILIVEFGLLKCSEGVPIKQAAIEAAELRLRPILMTSLAFVVGMIPLMISSGAGAAGNNSVGYAAGAGYLIAMLLGIMLTPPLFAIFKGIDQKLSKKN